MQFSQADRNLLVAIQHKANSSVSEFARDLKLKPHVVRRTLRRLTDTGVVQLTTTVNPFALGFLQYCVYFSISSEGDGLEGKLIAALRETEAVAYLCEVGGAFQYVMSLCVRDLNEVHDFFLRIADKFGAVMFDKTVSSIISITDYGIKSIAESGGRPQPIRIGIESAKNAVDSLDEKILRKLVAEPELTMPRLGRDLGIPVSTADYRVKQLLARKVLLGSRYVVYGDRLGLSSYRVMIKAKGLSPRWRRALFEYWAGHPSVAFVIELLGSWDFELGVKVAQQHEVTELTKEMNKRFGGYILSTQVFSTFRLLRLCPYPTKLSAED